MTLTISRHVFFLLLGLALTSIATALDVPYLTGRVNDNADLLSETSRASITSTLQQLEQSNGAQVAVLTIHSLQGDSLEAYSIRVAETWKLGRKGVDDGVLLLVARDDRKIRIEVGYGLEGVLTDLDSRRIIDNLMVPAFRRGDFEAGIEAAVKAIKGRVLGEADAIPVQSSTTGTPNGAWGFLVFFAIFMIPWTRFAVALKGRQGWVLYLFLAPFFFFFPLVMGQTIALISLLAWLLIIPLLRLIWPKDWQIEPGTGKGSGGSGWSGGRSSSGGGFSGGGGSFGGGGASGGW